MYTVRLKKRVEGVEEKLGSCSPFARPACELALMNLKR